MVNVAINGFGRIGRLVLRNGWHRKELDFVAINDLTDAKTLAHLLKYDSVHGAFPGKIEHTDNSIKIDGKTVKIISEKDPEQLPWKELNIDIVVESTGRFTDHKQLQQHLNAGAKKVLLSAPGKGNGFQTFVKGVNDKDIKDANEASNASCTTNSLVPVVDVLEKEFGIEAGLMTTVHAFTNDQRLLDLPHKDLRRGRAASINIIPTTTGAAKAVSKVLPSMEGKLDGMALRVPVICGSITDFTCIVKKPATVAAINKAMKKAADGYLKGVLEYSEEPLVSTDIIGNTHSSIFDAPLTRVVGNLVKVCAWYDNEMGYSSRMVDMLVQMT